MLRLMSKGVHYVLKELLATQLPPSARSSGTGAGPRTSRRRARSAGKGPAQSHQRAAASGGIAPKAAA